jgi:hypothetical protein
MGEIEETHTPSIFFCDKHFAIQLAELRKLKSFLLVEEKVTFDPEKEKSIDIGLLNDLRHRSWGKTSRPPTADEWKLLDEKLSILSSYLTGDLRHKFDIQELKNYVYTIPLWFLSLSMGAIAYYFLYPSFIPFPSPLSTASYLGALTLWTMCQGGLGACALLGTRIMRTPNIVSLSAPELPEEQVDITDKTVLKTRIFLGCVFAFIFGLPFSLNGLEGIRHLLFPGGAAPSTTSTLVVTTRAADIIWIVAPFILGFSINLGLALLDRFVASMRTFFGITGRHPGG